MILASNATGTAASMMFENTKPVRKSTLSSLMYFSAIWRPTSGLNWSSPTSTSAGRAPSLPPFIFTASWKPSRMSTPSAALGPESVLMKPTLTLSAACTPDARASDSVNAQILLLMVLLPLRRPILKRVEVLRHAAALRFVGKSAAAGGQVVQHVLRLGGAGNGAGHRGMGRNPFQEKLRPARDAEFRRPRRQRFPFDAPEQRALGEGPVHDHRHPEIARQREDVLFGIALAERVVNLHEIVLLRPQPALDLGISRRRVVGDADVTHALAPFPLQEGFRVGRDIDQVVHLHEVHLLHFQAAERLLHLAEAFVAAAGPDLGGDEQPLAQAEHGDEIARHGFARAVHRRGIDDACAGLGEHLQHLAQRGARRVVAADIEGLPGADADYRQRLARRGNRPRDQLLRVVWHHAACRERGKGAERGASSRVHVFILPPRKKASAIQAAEIAAATKVSAGTPPSTQPESVSPPR